MHWIFFHLLSKDGRAETLDVTLVRVRYAEAQVRCVFATLGRHWMLRVTVDGVIAGIKIISVVKSFLADCVAVASQEPIRRHGQVLLPLASVRRQSFLLVMSTWTVD